MIFLKKKREKREQLVQLKYVMGFNSVLCLER